MHTTRYVLTALSLLTTIAWGRRAAAQAGGPAPERVIRREIPLTRMVRHALSHGTRDSTGSPGRAYRQLWMEYVIDARLDPATASVTGRETVVMHNATDSAMHVIVLRLDQNIYAPTAPRAVPVPATTEGMRVTRLTVNGATADLSPPPGAVPRTLAVFNLTQTSAAIRLPTPIAAGGTATLEVDWHFRVPRVDGGRGLRMGAWGDSLYQVAQWYPRVAVFDDLEEGGWDRAPYLGAAEFYNNFGRFDVRLDVPAGWVVGATGVLQNPREVLTDVARARLAHVLESDSTRTVVGVGEQGPGRATAAGDRLRWHFVADTVGDFAWATSSRYVWDATRANIPGKGFVPVHILHLPGHTAEYARAGPAARHALEFYSRLSMPYAFPQLTVVDGPDGGMEYPMFVMSSADAADHEVGHQWWPMMVGTNETAYAFMDEGFDEYMNTFSAQDRSNRPPSQDGAGARYGTLSGDAHAPPLMWDANYSGAFYGPNAYGKAPMMLSMLGGIVGDTAVIRAMGEYARAWRFKHPSPWDYAFFMSHALRNREQDLGWFWYYWLFTTESVDGSIERVTRSGPRTTVTVAQAGAMPSPVVLKVQFEATGPAIHALANSRMTDSATAIVTWPAAVWFDGARTFKAVMNFGMRKILKVTLDPFGRFPDSDAADNTWPRDRPNDRTP